MALNLRQKFPGKDIPATPCTFWSCYTVIYFRFWCKEILGMVNSAYVLTCFLFDFYVYIIQAHMYMRIYIPTLLHIHLC